LHQAEATELVLSWLNRHLNEVLLLTNYYPEASSILIMTEQNRIAVYEVEPIEGQALVRRFTDSLQPLESKTTLEQSTIDAQAEEDRLVKESHHRRLQSLYENRNRDPAYVGL
jgi:hypothetical protein